MAGNIGHKQTSRAGWGGTSVAVLDVWDGTYTGSDSGSGENKPGGEINLPVGTAVPTTWIRGQGKQNLSLNRAECTSVQFLILQYGYCSYGHRKQAKIEKLGIYTHKV